MNLVDDILNLRNLKRKTIKDIDEEIKNKKIKLDAETRIIHTADTIDLKKLLLHEMFNKPNYDSEDFGWCGNHNGKITVINPKFFSKNYYKYDLKKKCVQKTLKETLEFKRISYNMSCSSSFSFYCLFNKKNGSLYADISDRDFGVYLELSNNNVIKEFLFWVGKHSEAYEKRNIAYKVLECLLRKNSIKYKINKYTQLDMETIM